MQKWQNDIQKNSNRKIVAAAVASTVKIVSAAKISSASKILISKTAAVTEAAAAAAAAFRNDKTTKKCDSDFQIF